MIFNVHNNGVNDIKLEKLFSVWLQQFNDDRKFVKEEIVNIPVKIREKDDLMSFKFTTDFYIRVYKWT